jgi:uncharacterized protein (TIGR02996 family)
MSDEGPFHAAIAARPDDGINLLVFADWLDDRSDPRAGGYRAMGRGPLWTKSYGLFTWLKSDRPHGGPTPRELPADWFEALEGWVCVLSDGTPTHDSDEWRDFYTSAAAFDAAARAFARLPESRRRDLLGGQ